MKYSISARTLVAGAILMAALLFQAGASPLRQDRQVDKTQRPRTSNRSQEPADTQGVDQAQADAQAMLLKSLSDLSNQVARLANEVSRLRKENERNSATLELALGEERLNKLEDKLQDALDRKSQLDAREVDVQRRMKNIQSELVLRGGLRRDESEAALRTELQRSLDDIHAQQSAYHQRAAELQSQIAELRNRIEVLRKRLEKGEEKSVEKQ